MSMDGGGSGGTENVQGHCRAGNLMMSREDAYVDYALWEGLVHQQTGLVSDSTVCLQLSIALSLDIKVVI